MKDVALITVIHDPKGKNLELFRALKDKFGSIYSSIYITVSNVTNCDFREELINAGFNVKVIVKNGAADARRKALDFGLKGEHAYYHYCDFDRILTWISGYYEELLNLVKDFPVNHYLIIGRTERAFLTHPIEWIETERISNKIFSLEFGEEVDIAAGSCGFSREAAMFLREYSKGKMTDGEWPMIIHRIAKLKVTYKAVEGLEYKDIANGYVRELTSSDKWLTRLRLAYIIGESAVITGKEID